MVLLLILSTLCIPSTASFFDFQAIYYNGNVSYLDRSSVFLAVILSVMVHFSLVRAKLRSNIFVLIINYYFIFYYLLRFVTLSLTGYSSIFNDYLEVTDLDNFNLTLCFLIFANSAIYLGFGLFSRKSFSLNIDRNFTPTPLLLNIILGVFFIAICIEGSDLFHYALNFLPRFFNPIILFLSPILFLFIGLVIFVIYYRNISRTYCSLFILVIFFYISISVYNGGKSIPIFTVETIFIILGALNTRIAIKQLMLFVTIVPLFVAFIYLVFVFATDLRASKSSIQPDEPRTYQEVAIDSFIERGFQSSDQFIKIIFNRAGYLDPVVNIYQHKEEYSKHINIKTLKNSFVDNILTPGFDLYDQPKHANALVFIYKNSLNEGKISKKFVSEGTHYQSDIFTLYGEMFLYFSWFSLLFIFLWAFVGLKLMIYLTKFKRDFLSSTLMMTLLLFVGRSYQSMGMDWLAHEIVPFLSIALIFGFVANKVKKYD